MTDDHEAGESAKVETKPAKKKKVSAAYLERAAFHYLGRFNSSEKNLHSVLVRKIRRRNENHSAPSGEQLAWVSDVVSKCVRYGYVNDEAYAKQRTETMIRRGKPLRAMRQDLRHKGIDSDLIESALAALGEESGADTDRIAAAAYIKRRRFGAFRRTIENREALSAKQEKELAAMARAGFEYTLSSELLSMEMEEISELLV